VRPLMYAHQQGLTDEIFEPEALLVARFVRAVQDLREGADPLGPNVFIINLSLGDRNRPFFGRASAWARALDWLSHYYGILFIVSAGNADSPQHEIVMRSVDDDADFKTLAGTDRAKAVLSGIKAGVYRRRILSPAEAVNALTVGALHADALEEEPNKGNSLDPYPLPSGNLPTPVSRVGPGVANAIKPDILMPGGRLRVTPAIGARPAKLRVSPPNRFGGLQVAGPRLDATGVPLSTGWSGATSGSAALTTRALHAIHDALEAAYPTVYPGLPPRQKALLNKALIVHRAEIPADGRSLIEEVFGPRESKLSTQRASNVFKMFGLGVPKLDETVACLGTRATLWGVGSIGADDVRAFQVPLPECLSAFRGLRRVSATVTWFTPVTPGRRAYRSVRLTVEEPEEHELTKLLSSATRFQPDRQRIERGTVFQRAWEGTVRRSFREGETFEIRIARKPDPFVDLPDVVDFAVVVSLECFDDDQPVYEQIRERISIKPEVAIPVRIRPGS